MKNKIILSVCFLGISFLSFAQEDDKSKFSYGLKFGVGSSTLENNQIGVLDGNLLAIRFNVDYNFKDDSKTKLTSGFEILEFNSSFFNGTDQSRLKNEYLQIPLRLTHRVNLDNEEKLNLIFGIGGYGNFLIRSRILELSDEINTKSGGFNFGYNISMGMDYNLTENTSVELTFDVMNETSSIDKNGYEQKQTEIYLIGIGFSTRF
ncbi:MAG: outer membrane beta-barrel protein [Winogradskyella sp.]|uniref:outer membrane beta-barrel protein n=1 Tax=Winogradskyella sp. TaxID=1883156 RepID=UPI001DA776A3|nr:outer membrane beta-barrel protein [Winogradskyella sp.]NQZ85917.1 outer membrane beta-barrel protein [Nanoarchaeales archaeon]NRB83497.1 outer membrane beta-barrel protein [Winogradskyella sp.]